VRDRPDLALGYRLVRGPGHLPRPPRDVPRLRTGTEQPHRLRADRERVHRQRRIDQRQRLLLRRPRVRRRERGRRRQHGRAERGADRTCHHGNVGRRRRGRHARRADPLRIVVRPSHGGQGGTQGVRPARTRTAPASRSPPR
jgi:hypothetical protein